MYFEGSDIFIMSAIKAADSTFYISQYDMFIKVCGRRGRGVWGLALH